MDPQDKQTAEYLEKNDPTARVILRGGQALPPEASTYVDEPISTYEETNGVPYTAYKLGYGENMKIDPVVEMKVRAVDQHIRGQMQEELLKDSASNYNMIFNRMLNNFGERMESAKNSGNMGKLLENLFIQVSIANKLSSKSYLQVFSKQYAAQRVSRLTAQLKDELLKLK